MSFRSWLEIAEYPNEFTVKVTGHMDQPILTIPDWGYIRLFYSSGYDDKPHWVIHMINGTNPGAGTILYFAALLWALTDGEKRLIAHKDKPTMGVLSCDSTLSPDAIRARNRMQTQYGDYLYVVPHPNAEEIKVHRGDNTSWRRKATSEEATLWRLKKMPPFEFKFI